jgi:hypothetical protein
MGFHTRRTAYSRYHLKGRSFWSRYTKAIRDAGSESVEYWPKGWRA